MENFALVIDQDYGHELFHDALATLERISMTYMAYGLQ